MEISGLDFFLINVLSYIAGLSTGLLVCCKHKEKFFGRSENQERELDVFQTQPYSPPPQAAVMASAPPPEQLNKGIRIVLE